MSEKRKVIKEKMVRKYRLVIMSDDSYEEKLTFKLNRLNIFVFGGIFSIILIMITSLLIAYTPLKEFIPGFESSKFRRQVYQLNNQLDALSQKVTTVEKYTESLKPTLLGDEAIETEVLPYISKDGQSVYQIGITNNDSIYNKIEKLQKLIRTKTKEYDLLKLDYQKLVENPQAISITDPRIFKEQKQKKLSKAELKLLESSRADSLFRLKVAREEQFSLFGHEYDKVEQAFIAPVKGMITEEFDVVKKHFAVDIVAASLTPVKAIAEGVVLFAEWSLETGHVLVLGHAGGYTSIYKHNDKLMVEQGELVKSGQIIASLGTTGSLSTGPHLHFEMWKNGYAVDPTNFMNFE